MDQSYAWCRGELNFLLRKYSIKACLYVRPDLGKSLKTFYKVSIESEVDKIESNIMVSLNLSMPLFDMESDPTTAGPRWYEYIGRFSNALMAFKIFDEDFVPSFRRWIHLQHVKWSGTRSSCCYCQHTAHPKGVSLRMHGPGHRVETQPGIQQRVQHHLVSRSRAAKWRNHRPVLRTPERTRSGLLVPRRQRGNQDPNYS